MDKKQTDLIFSYIGNFKTITRFCHCTIFHWFSFKFTIAIQSCMLPGCSLIWSTILPRRTYRYSKNDHAMETTRKRTNRGVRSYIFKHGGYVIKYPDFDDRYPALFSDDGVHLSLIGNNIFIDQIQSALETFRAFPYCFVFPYDWLASCCVLERDFEGFWSKSWSFVWQYWFNLNELLIDIFMNFWS